MVMLDLHKIDPTNFDDQMYMYDILKFRWSRGDTINVKHKCPVSLPSFDEHVRYLTSDKFKVIYRVVLGEISIGTIYIDKLDVNGTVVLPSELKKALKRYRGQEKEIDNVPQISLLIHMKLYALHPEIETHYASVNPNNTLSMNALLDNGYEHIESILAMKTKNGKMIQGKWSQ